MIPQKNLADDAYHLLVVDDDQRIRSLISRYLGEHGFRVSTAANAHKARKRMKGLQFDLIIIDVMMPGESGLELTRSIHRDKSTPVLMLTALANPDQRIEGLESGADDYLPKPFEPRELLLRINNIIRRTAKPEYPAIELVSFGPYQLSVKKRELKKSGKTIRLTDREQEIMIKLATNAGGTVARLELLGESMDSGERKVDVQINRLRKKIEPDPSSPKWLQTVRGTGYRLCVD